MFVSASVFLFAFESELQDPPTDLVRVAKLRHVVDLVVGGDSGALGLKVRLELAKAGKGKTKYGKMGHTDEKSRDRQMMRLSFSCMG